MKIKTKKSNFILMLIILTALFIRLYRISEVPAGFFADEAIRGFDAYSLLKTWHDGQGDRLPIFFKVFGEYTPPIQTYSEIPLISILGLNELAVRTTSAIYSLFSVILIYLIASKLFSDRIGLLAAFTLTITPWSWHYGRTGFEYNCYLTFFLAAIYTFLRFRESIFFLISSFTIWALTFYTYNPAKLIGWIFPTLLAVFNGRYLISHKKILFLSISLFILISLPSIQHILSGTGLIRFNEVSIFKNSKSGNLIITSAVKNYLSQFSPDFLFFKGDTGAPNNRHFSLGFGPLLITVMPLIFIGFLNLIFSASISKTSKLVMFVWIVIYPISGVLTELVSTNRSIIGVGLFSIITALGMESVYKLLMKPFLNNLYLILVTLILATNFLMVYSNYLKNYPLRTSDFWGWQYGPREIMSYFLSVRNQYDSLYMSGEFNGSEIFPKFYDPTNLCESKCKIGDFWREPSIYNPDKRQLFSLSPDYINNSKLKSRFQIKKTIHYPDGSTAFLIGEVVKEK